MPTVSGYITVEVDVADYDSDVSIEFYDLDEIMDTAQDNNYTKEEIVDWCFDNGLDMIDYIKNSCDVEDLIKILSTAVSEKIASLRDIIDNRNDLINNRGDKIKELEKQIKKLKEESDEEALKNVAY